MRLTTRFTLHALAAAALAAFAATSAVAADAFLKLGDIKGESTDKRLANQIEIESWSFGATRKARVSTLKSNLSTEKLGAVGGIRDADADASIPDPTSQALAVSDPGASGPKTTSKLQPTPVLSGAEGGVEGPVTISKPYEAGSMTFRGRVQGCAAGTTYRDATMVTRAYKYEFQDVFITSCATAGGGGLPMEEVSFNYGKIVTKATSASDKMQWDVGMNKKL